MTWKTSASSILYDYFKLLKCDDDEEEARRIIQTAAKLIKSSIKALNYFTEYPGVQDLTTENAKAFLPGSLKLLLQVLFAGQNTEKKQASLGVCHYSSYKAKRDNCTPTDWFTNSNASPFWIKVCRGFFASTWFLLHLR